ncbi:MAG: mercuric transporter MerT family protein [Gammaproteobacteria bacterium]
MAGRKGAIGAASGAVGLGTFSAAVGACCGVPWAVALLGVTGAVALARLAFLMPYALAGSILLLAVAFWLAYRRPAACADTCETRNGRPLRWLVWITAFLLAGLTVVALMPLVRS